MSSNVVEPYPARPTPLPLIHSSIGLSTPANLAKSPLSPLAGVTPPPSMSLSFPPDGSPAVLPSNPPDALTLPPCSAMDMGAPAPTPETGEEKGLWCVAKPSVPADTLQEAMNYACGEGGADCDEIKPHGSCYNPDTVVAHASYAFNSYWQKIQEKKGEERKKRYSVAADFGGRKMRRRRRKEEGGAGSVAASYSSREGKEEEEEERS
ncbi:uncharacterized protein LOC122083846 [Macadamia integrifolia]|uniref:uncharacterized protein LOC122083846 n=1 Tax=Macadamia integrifolia TaxID=60698 RepID=UPI001C4F2AB3|nr:uncharacterized protein LOC122083846 [Macadamia integrifolia]